jgi:hypothetical protein
MTCAAVETWLLTVRSADELPLPVRTHLGGCRGCAERLATHLRTDAAIRRLAPGPNPAARQKLAAALERTAQNAPSHTEPARPARRVPGWALRVAVGLAAVLLVAVGWIVGRATAPKAIVQVPVANNPAPAPAPVPAPPSVPAPAPPAPQPAPQVESLPVAPYPALPAGLAARAARSAARVAADPTPVAQTEAFDDFATAVRAEVVLRAGAGDADALPRLAGLHERVLKLGVARQLLRVPDAQRAAVAARIVAGLKTASDEVATAATHLPAALAELLKPVALACRDTADALGQGKPPAAPGDWPSPPTYVETVAVHAIRVAATDEPLARAGECVQLASALAQSAAVLSSAGLSDDAGRVGDAIATVLDAGVAGNLERVESADPAGRLKGEITLVRERADLATDPLERALAKATPVAKPGLEKALIASAPGHAKATGKPPKHGPKDKGNFPPGWQKK